MPQRVLFGGCVALAAASLGLAAAQAEPRVAQAAQTRDMNALRAMLKQRVDVNVKQADGATALTWAAHWDDTELAALLIAAGAKVDSATDLGVRPIHLACINRSAPMVKTLLDAGADANAAQNTGETALMTCARTGNLEAVNQLLARGAAVNVAEKRRGQTPLMWATAQKHPDVVRALIAKGAQVTARSKAGFTSLLFAAQQGVLQLVQILLNAGASVDESCPEHGSALVVATAGGHDKVAAFLLEKGANPNVADGNGMTALHYTVLKGLSKLGGLRAELIQSYMFRPNMRELAKLLLAHGANPNVRLHKLNPELPIGNGWSIEPVDATPFVLAAASLDLELMRTLVAAGADPHLTTENHTSALMLVAGLGQTRDRTESEEKTALQAAKYLVELGADVNAADASGQTALHGSAYTGSNPIIQFLVENGAKVNRVDTYGMSPLSIAEGVIPADLRDIDKNPKVARESTAALFRKLGAIPLTRSDVKPAASSVQQ